MNDKLERNSVGVVKKYDFDYATLYDLYIVQELTVKEIDNMYQCTHTTICNHLRRLNIPIRKPSDIRKTLREERGKLIYQLHTIDGLSQSEVAKKVGLSQSGVCAIIKKNNWQPHSTANFGVKNGMYGRTHTPETKAKLSELTKKQFSTKESREKHALLTIDGHKQGRFRKSNTKIEKIIKDILNELCIEYVHQFRLSTYCFDFCIANNLIECDGTFWHADPRFYNYDTLKDVQKRNLINDKKKNNVAKDNGYNLLRLWEYDIMNSREDVKLSIINYLGISGMHNGI